MTDADSRPPGQWVFLGGGSGSNGRPKADEEVLAILRRHTSWDEAFDELVGSGASDEEILAGGWLVEFPIPMRRELEAKLRARRPSAEPGLDTETVIAKVVDLHEPDGPWPTQETVAAELGYSVEWVRDVGRPLGGWKKGILPEAQRRSGHR